MKVLIFIFWCLLGFCYLLAGCSMELRADGLDVSWGIRNPGQAEPSKVEVHIDKDSDRTSAAPSRD